jgi:dephospho-CoA kinase
MNKIVAVVGLPGSGKSEAVKSFVESGYYRVYFGDVTFDEMKRLDLEINEKNERATREGIRKEQGMEGYAKLSLPKIKEGLRTVGKVVIESMYSFEEYKLLKSEFGDDFAVLAITASPATRYKRLEKRLIRPLTQKECEGRDTAQIENLHQGGPIAMAEFTIINEGSIKDLEENVKQVLEKVII